MKPERCESCGAFVQLTDAQDAPTWEEIRCACALADLASGKFWAPPCRTSPHTAERCREIRHLRGPLSPLEIKENH